MKSGKLNSNEIKQAKWLLGQFLAIISLTGLFLIGVGANWIAWSGILVLTITLIRPQGLVYLNRFTPILAGLVLLFVLSDFIRGRSDLIPPLIRMIALLVVYRGLQLRNRRLDSQLLLLSFFLLVISGVLSQELAFAFQLLIYAPLGLVLLFLINLDEESDEFEENYRGIFGAFHWKSSLRKWIKVFDRRFILFCGILYGIGIGLSALMFVSLPRFELGQALPFLKLQSAESLSGFSDRIEFGDVVSIIEDDGIAMRVDVTEGFRPSSPYWRMVVLDAYHSKGFEVSPSVKARLNRLNSQSVQAAREVPRNLLDLANEWTVYFEGSISAYLPTVESFTEMRFKNRQNIEIQNATRVIVQREINSSTLFYRMEAVHPVERYPLSPLDIELEELSPLALDTQDRDYLKDIGYPETLLVYPDGDENLSILESAKDEIGFNAENGLQDFIERATTYLQTGRQYSLQSAIPSGAGDSILRWIQSGGSGHCELYASAFVLLARYHGFPARIVTGYLGGDWNGYENYYMVRNRNAHAWVEIYDSMRGWVRVDPTPGNGNLDTSIAEAQASGELWVDRTFQAYLDSLKVIWYRRIVNFDQEDQLNAVEGARNRLESWINTIKQELKDGIAWVGGFFEETEGKTVTWKMGLAILVVLVTIALLTLLIFRGLGHLLISSNKSNQRTRLRAGKWLRRFAKSSKLSDPPSELIHSLEQIRYGDPENWPSVERIFADSKRYAKSSSRRKA